MMSPLMLSRGFVSVMKETPAVKGRYVFIPQRFYARAEIANCFTSR
jgi:hypothetical protein